MAKGVRFHREFAEVGSSARTFTAIPDEYQVSAGSGGSTDTGETRCAIP